MAALDHYLATFGMKIHIGLRKVNSDTLCDNATCDDLLEWADGTTFKYDPNVMTTSGVTANSLGSYRDCFYHDDTGIQDRPCDNGQAFLCQMTSIPPGYEYRNGKYYKVSLLFFWPLYLSVI